MKFRGRFAPSPTGLMHLGNARSALLGWLQARSVGGEFCLRIEDLDVDRCRASYLDALLRDLEWLGLDFDGPRVVQSQRQELYRDALSVLGAKKRTFLCTCSRRELQRLASAPHEGEEGPVYPGTCRNGPSRPNQPAATRFIVEPGVTAFVDWVKGRYEQDVAASVGDFVIQRADGVFSYQLAVVVDDAEMEITDVLRGDDLLSSTPRQLQLFSALQKTPPRYAHVPLLKDSDGRRMAKRDGSSTVAYYRERGDDPRELISTLAKSAGLAVSEPVGASELIANFKLSSLVYGNVKMESASV